MQRCINQMPFRRLEPNSNILMDIVKPLKSILFAISLWRVQNCVISHEGIFRYIHRKFKIFVKVITQKKNPLQFSNICEFLYYFQNFFFRNERPELALI